MMPNIESVKPWRCPQCHAVLGHVDRDGDGFRRLQVYRRAVPDGLPAGEGERLRPPCAAGLTGCALRDLRRGAYMGAGGGGASGVVGESEKNRMTCLTFKDLCLQC